MGKNRRAGSGSPLPFLFVAVFVGMIGYGIVVPLLPFYAREHASVAVLLGSLCAAAQFAGGPFLGRLSDRAGRRPVLLLCLLGASLAYLLLGLADSLPLLVAAVALAGLGVSAPYWIGSLRAALALVVAAQTLRPTISGQGSDARPAFSAPP